jgi:hypothetical protein
VPVLLSSVPVLQSSVTLACNPAGIIGGLRSTGLLSPVHSQFVSGGCCFRRHLLLFVQVLGAGCCLWALGCCLWAVGLIRVQSMFVGGGQQCGTWNPCSFCRVDVAGACSLGDVALSCCGSHGRGRWMWVAAIGDGEEMIFSPLWVVTKGSGGWEEESGHVWLPNKHCLYK